MARPKKIQENVQTPTPEILPSVARYSKFRDYDENPLTSLEIHEELEEYLEYGVKLRVDDKHWHLSKGKLSTSGSIHMPLSSVKYSADFLVAQERFVRAANRRDSNGNLAIGNIIDKSGNDISQTRL